MRPVMSKTLTANPVLGALARQEIGNYLRHKLFWVSAAIWALACFVALANPSEGSSTTGDGIFLGFGFGVLGIVTMAGLVRNSDRAAAVSGAVAVPQRIRTLALAATVVVPGVLALVWFVFAAISFHVNPPAAAVGPFGDHSATDFLAGIFAEGVVPSIGGPLLGLLIARWLPRRGVAEVFSVLVVVTTMVLQPLFTWAEIPRLAWVWIHFYAPGGIPGDPDRLLAYPGSPYLYICYQLTLCLLGVLVAMYRDPEADHAALKRKVFAVLGLAAVLVVLTYAVGPHEMEPSNVPSSNAGEAR